MKFAYRNINKLVAAFALVITVMNVNSNCLFLVHQPKIPKKAMEFRKF